MNSWIHIWIHMISYVFSWFHLQNNSCDFSASKDASTSRTSPRSCRSRTKKTCRLFGGRWDERPAKKWNRNGEICWVAGCLINFDKHIIRSIFDKLDGFGMVLGWFFEFIKQKKDKKSCLLQEVIKLCHPVCQTHLICTPSVLRFFEVVDSIFTPRWYNVKSTDIMAERRLKSLTGWCGPVLLVSHRGV